MSRAVSRAMLVLVVASLAALSCAPRAVVLAADASLGVPADDGAFAETARAADDDRASTERCTLSERGECISDDVYTSCCPIVASRFDTARRCFVPVAPTHSTWGCAARRNVDPIPLDAPGFCAANLEAECYVRDLSYGTRDILVTPVQIGLAVFAEAGYRACDAATRSLVYGRADCDAADR